MKSIAEGVVDRSALPGTVLDAKTAGKTLAFDVQRQLDRPVLADEDTAIRKCRLDYQLRQGLARDHAGKLVVPPMVRAADRLMSSMTDGEPKRVHRAALSFYNTRCEEMRKHFDKVARIRSAHSAMMVGVGTYHDDVFVSDNYLAGALSSLHPWEIGLSNGVMEKLGVSDHTHVLISRYPTTRVVAVQVVEISEASDDVVYLPIGNVLVAGEITSIADLLDGDRDGDSYVIRAVKSAKAKAELQAAFNTFWTGAVAQPLDRTSYTWKAHEERIEDPEEIAREKFMQKAAIGSITLDWYCAFVHILNLQAAGVETELTMEDLRQMMTDSLEACFDLKHGDGSDPMALHALMVGATTLSEVCESLIAQGLDMERIGKLAHLLGGQSVRKLAQQNLPFAITQGNLDFNAVQRFINSVPPYKPLEFIATLMVAKTLKTPLSYDLVILAAPSAKTLASVYRDRLFPTLVH